MFWFSALFYSSRALAFTTFQMSFINFHTMAFVCKFIFFFSLDSPSFAFKASVYAYRLQYVCLGINMFANINEIFFFFRTFIQHFARWKKMAEKNCTPKKKKQSLKIKSKWENVYKSHQVCDCLNGARETGWWLLDKNDFFFFFFRTIN